MASRKQVEAKAVRLGGKLEVNGYGAILSAPAGKLFDGLHYSELDFEDGKQWVWDAFWEEMKKISDCKPDCSCREG